MQSWLTLINRKLKENLKKLFAELGLLKIRHDFEVGQQAEAGFNFSTLSYELKVTKKVEINGSTTENDDIDIRGKDEKSCSIPLNQGGLGLGLGLMNFLSHQSDKSVSVDYNKRGK